MVHLANPSLAQTLNPLSQSPPSALSTRHWGRRAELGDTHGLADGAHFKSMLWTLRGAGKPQDTPQSVHPPTLPDTTSLETRLSSSVSAGDQAAYLPRKRELSEETRQALPPSTGPRPDCPPRPAAGPSALSCRAGRPPGLRVRSFLPDRIVFPATVPFASHAINFSLYQILPGSVQACCFFCHF